GHRPAATNPGSRRIQLVDLGGHDEVAFSKAVDLVGPQRNFGAAPGQQNVGVMTLLLGYLAHSIYKIQGLPEIRKCEISGEVVLVDHLPHWHFLPQISEFLALERRHAAPARNAGFTGQRSEERRVGKEWGSVRAPGHR